MSHVGVMSAKVSKFKQAHTFATPAGPFGGCWETACVCVCFALRGFEVRTKVQEFRDFQNPGTDLKTHTCASAPRADLPSTSEHSQSEILDSQ